MPIAGKINGSTSNQFQGAMVPFYALPSLNGTLTDWQTADDDAPPTLTWNSTSDQRVTLSTQESAGASVNWLFGSASGSESYNNSFVGTTTASTLLSFGGMELVDIERGAWFDDFRCATLIGNPASDDPYADQHKAAFTKYVSAFALPRNIGLIPYLDSLAQKMLQAQPRRSTIGRWLCTNRVRFSRMLIRKITKLRFRHRPQLVTALDCGAVLPADRAVLIARREIGLFCFESIR